MEIRLSESEERATNKLDSELDTIRGMRPIKVSFIPVKGSHRFHIKNTNRHYADPLNPQKKLDKYLSFTNGDFRVAAVPESISLLHSYLCM